MVNMSSAVFTSSSKNSTPLQYYSKDNNSSNTATSHRHLSAAVKMFKYQNIAPAPTPMSAGCAGAEIKTRKYTPRAPSTGGGPFSVDQTQSVQRRNARERNRVKQVNNSFARLRQHIPQTIITDLLKGGGRGPHKKISKVDTLRIAVEYIRRLQDLVDDLNAGTSGAGSATQTVNKARTSVSGLLAIATDNNTTTSSSSFSSSGSSTNSNLSMLAADSPTRNSPNGSGLATAEQLYYASAANGALQAFQQQQHQQQQPQPQFSSALLTAEALQAYSPQPAQTQTQLDAGCPSPTSSFNSSMSFDSGTFVHSPAPQQQLSPLSHAGVDAQRGSGNNNASAQIDANLQLKFEPYDSFNLHEEDCAPDDEEILDYISLWQEQ